MFAKLKWIAILSVLTIAVSGCGGAGAGNSEDTSGGEGTVEQPAAEAPADTTDEESTAEEDAGDEAATETPAAGSAEFTVAAGEPVEIETSIEGMTEKVTVTPYTIPAYAISYQLRDRMEMQPADADKRTVTYTTQMGEKQAQITVQVLENTTVNDAVTAMLEQMKSEGYDNPTTTDNAKDAYAIPSKMARYSEGDTFAGFRVFGFGEHSLVVKDSYPAEAADGMAAIMNEMLTSLTIGK